MFRRYWYGIICLAVLVAGADQVFAQELLPAITPNATTIPSRTPRGAIGAPVANSSPTPSPPVSSALLPPSAPQANDPAIQSSTRYDLLEPVNHGDATIQLNGRLQFDIANYMMPAGVRRSILGTNALEDAVGFRRLQLGAAGALSKNIHYFAEINFAGSVVTDLAATTMRDLPTPGDAWVEFRELPFGKLKLGNMKVPLTLENIRGDGSLTFLERSAGHDAFIDNFNNGYAPGILFHDMIHDGRATWALGLFKNTRSLYAYNVGRNEHDLVARATALPVDIDGGRTLLHVGVGGNYRDLDDDQQRFRARPDVRNNNSVLGPMLADTGVLYGSRQAIIASELALAHESFCIQYEYIGTWLTSTDVPVGALRIPVGTVYFQAMSVEASYLLTGERVAYDRSTGTFGYIIPHENATWSNGGVMQGRGAWQVAARFTYVNLNDKSIEGGQLYNMTLGLNWYLNRNMKLQTNYMLSYRNVAGTGGDGFVNGTGIRIAIDF